MCKRHVVKFRTNSRMLLLSALYRRLLQIIQLLNISCGQIILNLSHPLIILNFCSDEAALSVRPITGNVHPSLIIIPSALQYRLSKAHSSTSIRVHLAPVHDLADLISLVLRDLKS